MQMGEVESRIRSVGGQRDDDAYPLFWADSDGTAGFHAYYTFPDQTSLQVRVQGKFFDTPADRGYEREYKVCGFQLGPKGKPYRGKLDWLADEEAGRHSRLSRIDLSNYGASRN